MKLTKHFNFTNDSSLDNKYWNVAVGEKWANHELQHYVDDSEHLFFEDGLVLKATYQDGIYKSGRISTKHKFSFQYGRIDIVAKVPKGMGTWPALWMMSATSPYGRWPRSGEIDIMEHVGRNEDNIFLCLHTASYNHVLGDSFYKEIVIEGATDSFHTYSIDWQEDKITYYIDNKLIVSYSKFDREDKSSKGWPFDHPFFLIINLAIGGKFGGDVDNTIFPVEFIIKDIKIYQ
ncbi:MAG: glycoside hydrolase family 16 protein [Tenericutes bacterium]|nr:glycoside hydrolase family 16 protein [Mycoplasmatota bacterium]